MASTATGANGDDARTIRFKCREHEEFFWGILAEVQMDGHLPSGIDLLSWD